MSTLAVETSALAENVDRIISGWKKNHDSVSVVPSIGDCYKKSANEL
mgnify:CR=1 FL=1